MEGLLSTYTLFSAYLLPLTVNDRSIPSLQYFHENVIHNYFQVFCCIFNSWSSCSDVGPCSCVVYFQVSAHFNLSARKYFSNFVSVYNHATYGVCAVREGLVVGKLFVQCVRSSWALEHSWCENFDKLSHMNGLLTTILRSGGILHPAVFYLWSQLLYRTTLFCKC